MQVSEIFTSAPALRSRTVTRAPLLSRRCPSVTTTSPSVRPNLDNGFEPQRPRHLNQCDGRDIVLHDENEGALLADLHGQCRHHHRIFGPQRHRDSDERPRPQQLILVRHGGSHQHQAGRRIDGVFDHRDRAASAANRRE